MSPAALLEMALATITARQVANVFIVLLLIVFVWAIASARAGRHDAFVHYAPNLLTTLGILGTFIGIVIGLIGFDVQNIDESIAVLLAGLQTAFLTSLVGILLAILFKTLDSKGLVRRSDQSVVPDELGPEQIYAELREQRLATEALAKAISGDEESTLITQVKLLRSDRKDDAQAAQRFRVAQASLQKKIHEQLTENAQKFDEFSGALWGKLESFAEMLSKSATEQVIDALNQVIKDFNQNLTEQFGDNFKKLNEGVERLVEWQENYRAQLEHMSSQYEQGVQAITRTEQAVTQISERTQIIPEAMGQLSSIIELAQHQLGELERHLEAFKDMRDRAVEAVPQIREQMDAMVSDVSTAVKDAGEQIMSASQAVNSAIVEGAKEFEERVNRTNEGLVSASDHLANNSELIREQLEDTVKEVNAQVRGMTEAVSEQTQAIGNNLSESNKRLNDSIHASQEKVANSIEKMQKRLESSLQEVIESQSRETTRLVAGLQEELRKSVGTTGDAVNRQLEALDRAMEQELQRVMSSLGSKLGAITQQFTSDYSKLTEQMAKVVSLSRRQRQAGGR